MKKERLDHVMVERGLVESRSLAQRLVMAGQVRVNGQVAAKSSQQIMPEADIEVESAAKYVSRGGDKLEAALQAFGLTDLTGSVCVDVGASTGGFTDCMLQHGAAKIFAVDVGYGILHWKLRSDARVTVMERTNARFVSGFPEAVNLVTIDASFISLSTLLPVIRGWFQNGHGRVLALIKPQFEAGRQEAAKGEGVIRDPEIHRRVVTQVLEFSQSQQFGVNGLTRSPLLGPKGNVEFLTLLQYPAERVLGEEEVAKLVTGVIAEK